MAKMEEEEKKKEEEKKEVSISLKKIEFLITGLVFRKGFSYSHILPHPPTNLYRNILKIFHLVSSFLREAMSCNFLKYF